MPFPEACAAIGCERHSGADRMVAAARSMVGAPFRPQGRGPTAFDCLGLVLFAAAAGGVRLEVPAFPLRGTGLTEARARLQALGCRACGLADARPGDLLLSGPATLLVHFALRTDAGLVEANALLRRVAERPMHGQEAWDSAWRLPEGGD